MKNNLICVVLSSILLSGCGSGVESGNGKKIGQIVKIGSHGMFCPTYEAEIIRGGLNNGLGVNGASLAFSIKNEKLFNDLVIAMENQQEIELHYTKRNFRGLCYSETQTIATGFKVLNPDSEIDVEVSKSRKLKEVAMDDELVTGGSQ